MSLTTFYFDLAIPPTVSGVIPETPKSVVLTLNISHCDQAPFLAALKARGLVGCVFENHALKLILLDLTRTTESCQKLSMIFLLSSLSVNPFQKRFRYVLKSLSLYSYAYIVLQEKASRGKSICSIERLLFIDVSGHFRREWKIPRSS